jgi:DNA sulfur modification protein DndE
MNTHFVEIVRIDERGKSQLVTLKRRTGLKNWNVLCRWALCLSLSEPSAPPAQEAEPTSNVEMTWHTFAGKNEDLYSALVAARCELDGLGTAKDVLVEQFRLHLHRGLTYLLGRDETRTLPGLASLAVEALAED